MLLLGDIKFMFSKIIPKFSSEVTDPIVNVDSFGKFLIISFFIYSGRISLAAPYNGISKIVNIIII